MGACPARRRLLPLGGDRAPAARMRPDRVRLLSEDALAGEVQYQHQALGGLRAAAAPGAATLWWPLRGARRRAGVAHHAGAGDRRWPPLLYARRAVLWRRAPRQPP